MIQRSDHWVAPQTGSGFTQTLQEVGVYRKNLGKYNRSPTARLFKCYCD